MAAEAFRRKGAAARLNPVHRKAAEALRHHAWSWAEVVRRPLRVCWGAADWLRRRVCWAGADRPIAWVGWRAR